METHSLGRSTPWRPLSPRTALVAIAALVMAFGVAAWLLYLWTDHRSTLTAAHERGQASLDALEEHTRRLVVTNDLLLQQMSGLLQEYGVDYYRNDEHAWRNVRDLANLPQHPALLAVVDDQGQTLLSSNAFRPASKVANAAVAPLLAIHRDGAEQQMLIATTFELLDDDPFFMFSRRWEWPDGTFRGLLLSGVRAEPFLSFAQKLVLGPKSTVSIVRSDGLVLIRRPLTPDVVNMRLDGYELFTQHLARAPEGYYDAVSPADGEHRVVLYRKLEDLPLILIAGLANQDILKNWQSRASQTAMLVVLALGAMATITAFGVRHARHEAKALQELQAAREHERLLVAEVDHRARNLLSVIEAQIRQTARHSGTAHELAQRLIGRVHALASAHDLLSAEKWKEVSVRSLIEREVLPFATGDQIGLTGPSVRVSPKVAMSLAMALHELATNATKYGALSIPAGRVDIHWELLDGPSRTLRMSWRESGGPPVKDPATKGFGMTLIERSMPHELGGAVSLQFPLKGVQAEFTIPLTRGAPQ